MKNHIRINETEVSYYFMLCYTLHDIRIYASELPRTMIHENKNCMSNWLL